MKKKLLQQAKKKRKNYLATIPYTLLSYFQDAYALRLREPSTEISPYITVSFDFGMRNGSFASLIEAKQIQGQEETEPHSFFSKIEKIFNKKLDGLEKSNSFFEELYISKKELTKIYQKTFHLLKTNKYQVLAVWDDYNLIWQIHARL